MPLTPMNNDFLQCPICFNTFSFERKPVTLGCCHTCCFFCLKSLQNCPFDQTAIDQNFPTNEAILSLLPNTSSSFVLINSLFSTIKKNNDEKLINNYFLGENDVHFYKVAIENIIELTKLIKPQNTCNLLSRPLQRKLISLLHCQLVDEDGRLRAVKNARSIGERALSELLIKHQDPNTLGANLWAAIRSRGCQFLGPILQEEILKLVLSALEDGSHLSRKVLVMFVVQRLSPHFPHQASKTAIGHVIQLLYRASCFRLTKRDGDSSLMQLKEEYCSYEALRREHDTQIVSIALESGLKISPDQWSSFLYGVPTYKSHMQSIIDKLQSPESFHQSIQELIIALQRTHDPANLTVLKDHLERLAKIDLNSTNVESNTKETIKISYEDLANIMDSCKIITFRLIEFLKQYNTLFSNYSRYSSRNANFNNTTKFKNGKNFKSKSPTNEDKAKQLDTNCSTNGVFTLSFGNANTNSGLNFDQDYFSDTAISPYNLINKRKPCAFVPPTVHQNNNITKPGLINNIQTTNSLQNNQKLNLQTNNTLKNYPSTNVHEGSNNTMNELLNNFIGKTNGNLINLNNNSSKNFYPSKNGSKNQYNLNQLLNKKELINVLSNNQLKINFENTKKLKNKSNQNSFSFDDDQFIPFADQPFVSKFGPISRTMNLINTQTITGSTAKSIVGFKNAEINSNGTQITNVVLGKAALPSLIRPFKTSLFISNEPCLKK